MNKCLDNETVKKKKVTAMVGKWLRQLGKDKKKVKKLKKKEKK